jgi:hypothetical protein
MQSPALNIRFNLHYVHSIVEAGTNDGPADPVMVHALLYFASPSPSLRTRITK